MPEVIGSEDSADFFGGHERKQDEEITYEQISGQIEDALKKGQLDDVQKLRTSWNELSPISRIPAEILVSIFTILISESRDFPVHDTVHPQHNLWSSNWTSLTHVCRRWRLAALDAPSLWSRPPFHQPFWAEEMLERAQTAPLTVTLSPVYGESLHPNQKHQTKRENVMVKALGKIEQIESLCIVQPPSQNANARILDGVSVADDIPGITQPAPRLHTFTFFSNVRNGSILPENLFDRAAPRLRCLQLKDCTLPWTEAFLQSFNSLRSLTIESRLVANIGIASPLHVQSAVQTVSVLRFLPQLEVLHLEHLFESMIHHELDQPPSHRFPVATLPNLKSLFLEAGSNVLPLILGYIEYPSSANVQLQEANYDIRPGRAQTLRITSQRLRDDIRFLSFNEFKPRSLMTAGSSIPETGAATTSDPQPSQFTYTSLHQLSTSVLEELPLDSLEFFELSVLCTVNVWKAIGSFNTIRTLDVCGEMIKSLIGILLTTQLPNEIPFFSGLKRITFRRMAFLQNMNAGGSALTENQKIPPEQLKYCIQARRGFGCALERLDLNDCVVPSELVTELRKMVREVVLQETVVV